MKKKKLLLILMIVQATFAFSQNGLQQILIEKYYVSNATDAGSANTAASNAGYPTGTLPAGSVTWRIYADLEPGWGVQSVYGVNGHPLELKTSTGFYNHPSGNSTGGPLPTGSSSILASGTTFLDSYISCGAVANNRFGVVKSEDNSAATPTGGGANLNFSPSGVLANNDTSIGLPLTTADGMYNTVNNPALLALTILGDLATASNVALLTDGSTVGNTFVSSNTTWGVLGEQVGAFPSGSNRVLIGQFTTNGEFTYKLNLQLRNTTNFQIRNFVHNSPVGNEILFPTLSGVLSPCAAIASPGSISGNLSNCLPAVAGNTTLSVNQVPGAVSYAWTVPSGLTITSGQGTNSINVAWTSNAIDASISGNVTVTASNSCGSTSQSNRAVQLSTAAPVTPGSISGPLRACPGDVISFSVSPVARATSYSWTLPAGLTVLSGSGTNAISVSVVSGFSGGTVSVIAANLCGSSPVRTRLISVNTANTPGLISGPAAGLCGSTSIPYSIASVSNASSYSWTVPTGATISSGQGTPTIVVNFGSGFTSGQITVNSVNACGNSGVRTFAVSGAPARPGAISGITNPTCAGQSYTYGVASVSGATSYLWTISPGGTISFPSPLNPSGKDAQISWGNSIPVSQSVQVRTVNACGTSLTRTSNISVNSCAARFNEQSDLNLSIYPNPANDRVSVTLVSMYNDRVNVQIIDASGKLVLSRQLITTIGKNLSEISLEGFSPGIYNILLSGEKYFSSERFVIE